MKIDLYCQRCIDYVDILLGVPPLEVYNRNTVSANGDFLALCVNISISRKRYEIRPMLLLMTNRNLHMRCRLAARLMTLDDLELLYVWIFSEFRVISQIWQATTAKRITIDLYCQRCIDYVDILLGVPPLGGLQYIIVCENGDFQPLHPKISRNSQTVSNAATVTINHQLEICYRFLR